MLVLQILSWLTTSLHCYSWFAVRLCIVSLLESVVWLLTVQHMLSSRNSVCHSLHTHKSMLAWWDEFGIKQMVICRAFSVLPKREPEAAEILER